MDTVSSERSRTNPSFSLLSVNKFYLISEEMIAEAKDRSDFFTKMFTICISRVLMNYLYPSDIRNLFTYFAYQSQEHSCFHNAIDTSCNFLL